MWPLPWPRPLHGGPPPYTVHGLFLAVQALSRLDEAAYGVNGEVLPVPVARRLQEAVAHGPVEALVLVCGVDLIDIGAQRDLLWWGWGRMAGRLLGHLREGQRPGPDGALVLCPRLAEGSCHLPASLGNACLLSWTLLQSEHLPGHPFPPSRTPLPGDGPTRSPSPTRAKVFPVIALPRPFPMPRIPLHAEVWKAEGESESSGPSPSVPGSVLLLLPTGALGILRQYYLPIGVPENKGQDDRLTHGWRRPWVLICYCFLLIHCVTWTYATSWLWTSVT